MINNKSKTIVICSNYAWTIFNFRMPLIRSLTSSGFKVVLITQFDGYEKKIASEVHDVVPLFISRKGINPIIDIITLIDLVKKLKLIKPDYLFVFTIKPVIYGSLAARFLNIPNLVTITGLGTTFISKNWLTKVVKFLYRFSLKNSEVVFFQNNDDKQLFINSGLINQEVCKYIPGSGIDLNKFKFFDLPDKPNMTFLLIARMLGDKGIYEFIDAARILKKLYPKTNFQLLGAIDVENRTAITSGEINNWVNEGVVDYLGTTDNVSTFIRDSSCIVLPSYREGASRVLLEAAAIGRPIITSDVPGCNEIVQDGINGFLCKAKDSNDLFKKLKKMTLLPYESKVKMSLVGRKKIEDEFDQSIVNKIYKDVLVKLTK